MAKMYEIRAFIVDPNDRYKDGEECFKDMIDRKDVFCPTPIQHRKVEFEWDDNLIINYIGCTEGDCVKFMKEQEGK